MRRLLALALLFLLAGGATADDDPLLRTTPLRASALFAEAAVRRTAVERIAAGVYDRYGVDLCIDDPKACEAAEFAPYRQEVEGVVTYSLVLKTHEWAGLHPVVQDAVLREIMYYTWGHPSKPYSPVDVALAGEPRGSPFDRLAPSVRDRYCRFAKPEHLVGGKGGFAYGPNCWFTAISAIADQDALYAKERGLAKASWTAARFMGPSEFRALMDQFDPVETPRFGDIVRYYVDDPIYVGLVFGGEIHAAVYVGREAYAEEGAGKAVRPVVLTKNGRSDNDFLVFQDARRLDETYTAPLAKDDPLSVRYGGKDPRKKGYFRARTGAKILDPAVVGRASDAFAGYAVDLQNYRDRWACLAGELAPPEGKSCTAYPTRWLTLGSAK